MKKIILFVAVVSAISFASCKKDRTCTCSSTTNGVSDGPATVTVYTKAKKGDARSQCLSTSIVYTVGTLTATRVETCTLN